VSFGTMPEFAYRGAGVKVASVIEGSPAAKAGIQKGDILLAMDGAPMKDLRAFSQMLARHNPGDVVKVRFQRGDEEQTVEATLTAR
jgi:S1-C subfamily serine protease